MDIKDLTPEQRKQAIACKTTDELIQLAKDNGIELSDEQLNAISGGDSWYCPCDNPDGHSCPDYCSSDW